MSEKATSEKQNQPNRRREESASRQDQQEPGQLPHFSAAQQASGLPGLPDHKTAASLRRAAVLQMQRSHGNQHSARVIAMERSGLRSDIESSRSMQPVGTASVQREEVSAGSVYERISGDAVYETLAHEMVYEDELNATQRRTLQQLGYQPRPLVTDPVSDFQMRGFAPLENEAGRSRSPVLAFRGSESIQDVLDDLNERGIGALQMRRNLGSIMDEMEALGGQVVVAGHSLGGVLAQMAAALYPSRVIRVVTFQSPGIPAEMLEQLERYNESVPEDQRVTSDHYQAEGGIIDQGGQAFTPGTITELPTDLLTLSSVIGGVLGSGLGPGGSAAGFTGGRAISAHTTFIIRRLRELRQDDPEAFRDLTLEVHQVQNGDMRPVESIRSTLGLDRSDID